MPIERITGFNQSSRSNTPEHHHIQFKFVVIEGPDGMGYVCLGDGQQHTAIFSRFLRYLEENGIDANGFKHRGGGHYSFEPAGKKTKLTFFGTSQYLGEFDRNLLEETLEECLDKEKFEYEIGEN